MICALQECCNLARKTKRPSKFVKTSHDALSMSGLINWPELQDFGKKIMKYSYLLNHQKYQIVRQGVIQ